MRKRTKKKQIEKKEIPTSRPQKIPLNTLILVCLAVVLIAGFNFSTIKNSFRMQPSSTRMYQDTIDDLGKKLKKDAVSITGDFSITRKGVILRPAQRFTAEYRFEKRKEEEVYLQLWFYREPGVSNQVVITRPDGKSFQLQNTNLQGSPPINLTEQLRGYTWFDLRLSASLSPGAPDKPVLVYDGINIKFSTTTQVPPLQALGYMLVFTMGIFLAISFYSPLSTYAIPVSVSLLFVYLIAFVTIGEQYVSTELLSILSVGIAVFSYWRFSKDSPIQPIINLLVLWIVASALDIRWEYLKEMVNKPLDPDAVTYISIARNMNGPFDTDFREPFFMWGIKLFFILFGGTKINLRLYSIFVSLVTIWFTYLFAQRVTRSQTVGLLSAFILAQSHGYIFQNLRGLRLETYLITIIPFIYVLLQRKKPADWKYCLLVGVLAGLNQLNNLSAMSFCILLILYFAFRQKWKLWLIPVPIAVAMLITLPHLIHNKKQFNDAFYSSNIHARYYRNQEFKGQPGFPTVEEVRKNGYAGPPITTFEYFFKLHTLPQIIKRTLTGFKLLYFGNFYVNNVFKNQLFYYFYIIGLVLMIFYLPDLIVCFVLLSATSLFLIGTFIYFDVRLTMHIVFITVTLSAFGIVRSIQFLQQKIKTS
ncbi:glycosyltransferase family 39 protein [Candidatus Sumerlaeota bacterium]|nr:glycosyltransferase family 39 protein [Candidatus Sumerlaeota bacterium]